MWPKYLPLATFACNNCKTPNLANYRPYKLVFGRKPKLLLKLETTPDIKVLGTLKDYYILLNKRLQYLHKLLQDFRSKRLAMIKIEISFNIMLCKAVVSIVLLLLFMSMGFGIIYKIYVHCITQLVIFGFSGLWNYCGIIK